MDFTVTLPETVTAAEISPLSRGIEPSIEGRTVRFRLPEAGQYLVRLNDTAKLFIFAEKPALKAVGTSIMEYKGIDNTGTTNVTAAVQRAVDDAREEGPHADFPRWEYLCGQLRLPSHAHTAPGTRRGHPADASSAARFRIDRRCQDPPLHLHQGRQRCPDHGSGAIDRSGRALREKVSATRPAYACCWP